MSRSRRFERAVAPKPRPDLVTIGSEYGGWTIPSQLFGPESICLGGGVGNDISFDVGLIDRFGCRILECDPTPSANAYISKHLPEHPRLEYEPVGIWSEDRTIRLFDPDYGDQNFSAINLHATKGFIEVPAKSVRTLMSERGFDRLDLLKLDIEGAEFEVIPSLVEGGLEIGVLCVEFHRRRSIGPLLESVGMLRKAGFEPVHVDGYDVTFVNPTASEHQRVQPPAI